MIIYFIIPMAVTVVIVVFATHIGWKSIIKREIKQRKVGRTSNRKKTFRMNVSDVDYKGSSVVLSGKAEGTMPARGDVIFVDTDNKRVPVFVRNAKAIGLDSDSGTSVSLKVYGVKKTALQNADSITVHNIRDRSTVKNLERMSGELIYPFVVKATKKNLLTDFFIMLIGVMLLGIAIIGIKDGMTDISIIICLCCGLFMGGIGLYILLYDLIFRIKAEDEETLIIKKLTGTKKYNIDNLRNEIVLPVGDTEVYRMEIKDPFGQKICHVDDTNDGFIKLREMFIRNGERLYYKFVADTVRDREFYIPTVLLRKNGTGDNVTTIAFMVNSKTNEKRLFIYESESVMKAKHPQEYEGFITGTLADAVMLCEDFTHADDVGIIFENDDDSILITKEKWDNLSKML